jgi:hypothetical protein
MLAISLFAVCPLLSAAGEPLLIAEFSAEIHPLVADTPEPPTKEQIVRALLAEAQFTFSGMIYGFDFVYDPGDPVRKTAESFDLKPVAELRWGDPRLKVVDTRTSDGLLFARISYRPADFQVTRWQGWQSSAIAHASGLGKASYLEASKGRHESVINAIKNAIREHVRQRVYNRPREIRGSLALLDAPRIAVDAMNYVATVRIALQVTEVVPYTVF